jgi:endonuclease/exonuclease/phosphatase family metal-dependent hydrolase
MAADPKPLRVLSWNVHGFVGRAGKRDAAAVLRAVHQFDADIVALQEIDERFRDAGDSPTFMQLRDAFGPHSAEARTICSPDGDYGHVLMSRWPLTDGELIDLSVRRREPRLAISARVAAPGGTLRVVAAHLGLSARERRHQLAVISQHLAVTDDSAAVVLGDFNDWRRKGSATRELCPPFVEVFSRPSFPAYYPLLPLDRIWCRQPLRAIAAGTADAFAHLSDHLPVFADLEFLHEMSG